MEEEVRGNTSSAYKRRQTMYELLLYLIVIGLNMLQLVAVYYTDEVEVEYTGWLQYVYEGLYGLY